MDTGSRTAQLCIAGTQAEYERRLDDARRLYREAWEAVTDDYDACYAHQDKWPFLARLNDTGFQPC